MFSRPFQAAHADGGQQRDQRHALHGHAFLAAARVVGHEAVEDRLPGANVAGRQRDLEGGVGEERELERSGEQQRDPEKQEGERPRGSFAAAPRLRTARRRPVVRRVVVRGTAAP